MRYVMLWNGGLYHGKGDKNVFSLAELEQEFRKGMWFEKDTIAHAPDFDDDPVETDLDGLFRAMIISGEHGEPYYILDEQLVERGCDYVQASLVAVNF